MFGKLMRRLTGGPTVDGRTMRAVWNDAVVAKSDGTVVVEGNHYFPPESVRWAALHASDKRTVCPWKGQAAYYGVEAGGKRAEDAAWTYPQPSSAAAEIKDHVAFGGGVEVRPAPAR